MTYILRNRRSLAAQLIALTFVAVLAGCQETKPIPPVLGPTLSMAEVVDRINQNNQALTTLWARQYYEADFIDPKTKKSTFVNGDGVLLFRPPFHFRLQGNKDLAGTIFEIGSTDEFFWLTLKPEVNRMYYFERKNLGKPCVRQIPIQPDLISEVLGVGVIDTNFQQMPAPVMRYNPDARCYMFVWVTPAGGPGSGGGSARLAAQREIWYDRETFLPRQVMLFDPDGRVLARALLENHKAVGEGAVPKVATKYRLFFPDSGSKMSIELTEMAFSKGPKGREVPKNRGIAFPGKTPDEAQVNEVIKLDKDCPD